MHNFVLYDEYIEEMIEFFTKTSDKTEMQLSGLISKIDDICKIGVMEGNRSDELKLFRDRAESLNTHIIKYGELCRTVLKEFLEEINDIDRIR